MNFVKGFLRRSSASSSQDLPRASSGATENELPAPPSWPDIQFSENEPENELHSLWEAFESASAQKKRGLKLFVARFNEVFEAWSPEEIHEENGVVAGCFFGHPTRVISGLVQELKSTSARIAELHASSDSREPPLEASEMEASVSLLRSVSIITRSSHNRTVFSHLGGLQVSTGLMKNCVVYMKGVSGTAPPSTQIFSNLQTLLASIVSIMGSFIASEEQHEKKSVEEAPSSRGSSGGATNFALLLETGGLNWFVELLRVLRKLRLRGVSTDESLEKLVLQTLRAVIAASSRAQNHFRSIGGLAVLLDGLGLFPSSSCIIDERAFAKVMEDFDLQVLSLEVVREAVFRNLNSLQSFRDTGGSTKLISVLRWTIFSFPGMSMRISRDSSAPSSGSSNELIFLGVDDYKYNSKPWNTSLSRLSRILSGFLATAGDIFTFDAPASQENSPVTSLYWENAVRFIVSVLLGVFRDAEDYEGLKQFRLLTSDLQRNTLDIFKKLLAVSPSVLKTFRDEGVWTVLFSKFFFYYGLEGAESIESQPLQLEVISFTELVASVSGNSSNLVECSALVQALEQCTQLPSLATMLLKSLHRILQLAPEPTSFSFMKLDVIVVLSEVMAMNLQTLRKGNCNEAELLQCRDAAFLLFNECLSISEDAKSAALKSNKLMDVLFSMVSETRSRNFAIHHLGNFMKLKPSSEEDQDAKMELCMKFLETLSRVQAEQRSASILPVLDLLSMLRDVLRSDFPYYQALFRDVECFVHIVSLLNESYPEEDAKTLCLEVNSTLIHLLKGNESSKAAFRSLVGPGYKMLETLLLTRYGNPTESLINSLLDMLVDDKFNVSARMIIQNDDITILLFSIIRQCDQETQLKVLSIFLRLLEESSANQSSSVRAGLLSFLLEWFSYLDDQLVLRKVSQCMQLVGGHSMAGKEMRKIFKLLQDTMASSKPKNTLLLTTFKSMFSEQGPSVFFELSGKESGIVITTPVRWPTNKGFSFMCWMRIESSSEESMGLFSFLTEAGKGYTTLISSNSLRIEVESSTHNRQSSLINLNLEPKMWHHLCLTHSTGRALSTGSVCKVYINGELISNEKLRYPKVYDPLSRCTIGASAAHTNGGEETTFSASFRGQLGAIYLFDDVLSAGQVQGICLLGAGYMYSFLPSEVGSIPANAPDDSLFSSRDGLSSKMVFGYNALASSKRSLFDVAPVSENLDSVAHEASILPGTQLCYRCLVQNNIQCVGGITVFFPLLTRLQQPLVHTEDGFAKISSDADDYYLVDVIELLTAAVEKNYANQKFLHGSGGLSVLGFLLQLVSIKQLSVKVISAINTLLFTIAESNDRTLSTLLVKEAILKIYLNPTAWIFSPFVVQRELYLSLINFLDMHKSFENVCSLSRYLDILLNFYWDKPKSRRSLKGIYVSGERPGLEQLSQLRILILSLAEGTIRHKLTLSDTKSMLSFIDRNDDMLCVEEVLQMLLGLMGDSEFLSSLMESLHVLNGVQVFLNLLKRQQATIRLLALHIIGVLLVPGSSEKKTSRLFGNGDSATSKYRSSSVLFSLTERLLQFPLTDDLRVTLFDIALGATMPKQMLSGGVLSQFGRSSEKRSWVSQLQALGNPAHTSTFPQLHFAGALRVILKFVENSDNWTLRQDILKDIIGVIEVNELNSELLVQESGWNDWFFGVLASASLRKQNDGALKQWTEEVLLLRRALCLIHSHAVLNVKGGWRQIEGSVLYVEMYTDQDHSARKNLLYDLLDDVVDNVIKSRSAQTSISVQPCRDNLLYLLSLVEELIVDDTLQFLPKPDESEDNTLLSGSYVDVGSETKRDDFPDEISPKRKTSFKISYFEGNVFYQRLYENIWTLLSFINGVSPSSSSTNPGGPSFGQRARGLVESLNIPAAEVAAAVTGGLGSVGINVPTKHVEKAMRLRGEKFSRLAFRLVLLCLHKGDLEMALASVQQFLPLAPGFFTAESDQNKGQLQLLLWTLLDARKQMLTVDDGARYHILSQVIQELLEIGKSNLATGLDKSLGETKTDDGSVYGLLQQEKVLQLVREEKNFMRSCRTHWARAADDLSQELSEAFEHESRESKALEENFQASMISIHNSELSRRAAFHLKIEAEEQAVASQWCLLFRNLTDERGPWSSGVFPSLTPVWWKLDKTEDPLRRRMKLKRNYHFDRKLLQPPDTSSSSSSTTQNSNSDNSQKNPPTGKKLGLRTTISFTDRYAEDEEEMHDASEEFDNESETGSSANEDEAGDSKPSSSSEDEVLLSISCVLVSTKHKLAGRLEITNLSLHFHMEFVIDGTGGSMVFDSTGGFSSQIVEDHCRLEGRSNIMKQHKQWDLLQITAIYTTRYLLQPTALEIFFSEAAPPVFLNFYSQELAKEVALKLLATRSFSAKGKTKDKEKNQIHFVDRKKAVELAEKAKECWKRRECSNFDYLMMLNTLACRSYNDLTQYPVFPWILADYSSQTLDLSNPGVYRDLSKPVGALDKKRFMVFQERYDNFNDPEIPSFHYGSHYSSMGIVLFYLLRLEPFSNLHRVLQGGKFDHADRLFHSIQSTYANCLTNTSDVKEIIPEFFYMPEFLTNTNNYFIGVKQDGQGLDNVILPPWAKGSPEEFIRLNREALESEHTSENLHHWIDLIFGYKQRGRPAVEAANVFYYLTYEGAVDLDSITDKRQKASIEDQIANFGQTPIQLFRKKHPRRGPFVPLLRPLYYSPASIVLTATIATKQFSPSSASAADESPALYVGHIDGKIVSVTSQMIVSTRFWITPSQSGGSFTFSSAQDLSFGLGSEASPSHKIRGYFAESFIPDSSCFCLLQPNNNTSPYLLTCGHWDNSFKLLSLADGHTAQSNCQHKDVVTCVSASADGSVVVTGSRDTTVMVWEVRKRGEKAPKQQQELIISDKPRHVLCGHDDSITSVVVRSELDLVVSGSSDGSCILHTLRQGRYVRSLVHPSRKSISHLVVSQHGFIVVFSNEDLGLKLCSVNGMWLAEVELNGRLSCMQLSSCGEFLLCAGDQGQVFVRKMQSLELVHRYDGGSSGSPILSLCVTPEDCFVASTRDGKLLVYAVETSIRSSRGLPR